MTQKVSFCLLHPNLNAPTSLLEQDNPSHQLSTLKDLMARAARLAAAFSWGGGGTVEVEEEVKERWLHSPPRQTNNRLQSSRRYNLTKSRRKRSEPRIQEDHFKKLQQLLPEGTDIREEYEEIAPSRYSCTISCWEGAEATSGATQHTSQDEARQAASQELIDVLAYKIPATAAAKRAAQFGEALLRTIILELIMLSSELISPDELNARTNDLLGTISSRYQKLSDDRLLPPFLRGPCGQEIQDLKTFYAWVSDEFVRHGRDYPSLSHRLASLLELPWISESIMSEEESFNSTLQPDTPYSPRSGVIEDGSSSDTSLPHVPSLPNSPVGTLRSDSIAGISIEEDRPNVSRKQDSQRNIVEENASLDAIQRVIVEQNVLSSGGQNIPSNGGTMADLGCRQASLPPRYPRGNVSRDDTSINGVQRAILEQGVSSSGGTAADLGCRRASLPPRHSPRRRPAEAHEECYDEHVLRI